MNVQVYSDKERAQQILIEIIRCAGGRVECTTRLYKMFYFAHLYYAKVAPDFLSEWPIVRMPHGPGIGDSNDLFRPLLKENMLRTRTINVGPYEATEYETNADVQTELSFTAIDAIRNAVLFCKGKSATELSNLTHEHSHSWRDGKDGDTLNIYVDLFSEQAYLDMKRRATEDVAVLRSLSA